LLAGLKGNTYSELVSEVDNTNMSENVFFLGQVEDVTGLLLASDLKVLSSNSEGCPNAVLEAMAVGLPVVATCILGTREALGDNYKYLSKPFDHQSMGRNIAEFYKSLELRIEIGQQNLDRVEKKFSLENLQMSYLKFIQKSFNSN
jgi:glycosyltransferase involved in cell wall biosynthesis